MDLLRKDNNLQEYSRDNLQGTDYNKIVLILTYNGKKLQLNGLENFYALVNIVEGQAEITISWEAFSLKAPEKYKMLLVMIKS